MTGESQASASRSDHHTPPIRHPRQPSVARYPSVFLLTGVIIGIVVADKIGAPALITFPVAIVSLLGAVYAMSRRRIVATSVLLALTLLAISAFQFSLRYQVQGPNDIRRVIDPRQRWQIHGTVSDWPDLRADRTEITIDVDSVVSDRCYPTDGAVLLKVNDTTTALQRGDCVSFTGRIYPIERRAAPGEFDYGRYLNLHGVRGIVYLPTVLGIKISGRESVSYARLIDNLRAAITASFDRNLTPLPAALAGGFLIGETRHISPDIYRLFRDSGTLHLLAVSGSNVALVVLFIMVLLRPFGLRPAMRLWILLAVIVVFSGLCYGEPSVIRASIMAGLVIIGRALGRPFDLNQVIATTALIILLADPAQLFDIGFQLSFVTAWGLILLVPVIAARFERHHGRWWYRWLVFPLTIALIAQAVSTPIVVVHFQRIPVISVLANLVIVPLVSVAVVAVLILLLADLIWPLLGAFVGSLVDLWLQLVIWVLQSLGGDSLPVISAQGWWSPAWDTPLTVAAYALLILAVFSLNRRFARRWLTIAASVFALGGLTV
ncbi:DUF4131 domain-containing protein, partial [candidate division GN15 bacterium]|nr:DUF4131 domain-containing protein [candidate division GN15 bacterium]